MIYWLLIGFLFIGLELSLLSGIGFLFLALGSISNAVLLELKIIDNNLLYEIISFALLSAIWALVLWLPLKYLVGSKHKSDYKI